MFNPITELPVDISELPADLRSYLLSLPNQKNPVGRPRLLTFRQRLTIAIRWREVHDAGGRLRGARVSNDTVLPVARKTCVGAFGGLGRGYVAPRRF